DSTPVPPVTGVIQAAAAQRLIQAAGGNFEQLLNAQPGSSFRASTLPLRATLEVATQVTRYNSNNVIGRIRGSGTTNESVLLLAHWDHFGICRPEGEADRICNGAVDNASGVAMMLEVAGRLGRQSRAARDVLVLATTSEEVGLLGAEYFAAHPVVPAASIAAAINMDTVAIHPAGEPVAVLGRGLPALDRVIDETVVAMGRRLDTDDEAAAFISRQDGYKLLQAGIPAIMVGGSFSNMELLNAFLSGPYHAPSDQLGGRIVLDGAAEDANLTVALVRRLADPAVYQRPSPQAAEDSE
ncbi:MAG TPA: M28 family peptidase, partial [Allosphingosinicella sp.]|nr:M28 family peptidase [Allosphingosinicella sp.]